MFKVFVLLAIAGAVAGFQSCGFNSCATICQSSNSVLSYVGTTCVCGGVSMCTMAKSRIGVYIADGVKVPNNLYTYQLVGTRTSGVKTYSHMQSFSGHSTDPVFQVSLSLAPAAYAYMTIEIYIMKNNVNTRVYVSINYAVPQRDRAHIIYVTYGTGKFSFNIAATYEDCTPDIISAPTCETWCTGLDRLKVAYKVSFTIQDDGSFICNCDLADTIKCQTDILTTVPSTSSPGVFAATLSNGLCPASVTSAAHCAERCHGSYGFTTGCQCLGGLYSSYSCTFASICDVSSSAGVETRKNIVADKYSFIIVGGVSAFAIMVSIVLKAYQREKSPTKKSRCTEKIVGIMGLLDKSGKFMPFPVYFVTTHQLLHACIGHSFRCMRNVALLTTLTFNLALTILVKKINQEVTRKSESCVAGGASSNLDQTTEKVTFTSAFSPSNGGLYLTILLAVSETVIGTMFGEIEKLSEKGKKCAAVTIYVVLGPLALGGALAFRLLSDTAFDGPEIMIYGALFLVSTVGGWLLAGPLMICLTWIAGRILYGNTARVEVAKDTSGKDTSGKDTSGKDTGGKDTSGKDTSGKEVVSIDFANIELTDITTANDYIQIGVNS